MKLRVLPLIVAGLFLLIAGVASAGDLTSVYVKAYTNALDVLNITETNGTLSGYFQELRVDANSKGGTSNVRYSIVGAHAGAHIVLNINPSFLGAGTQWTGTTSWGGITIDIPQQSGQISELTFRRSSVPEVNRMVYAITNYAERAKATQDTTNEYVNASRELNALQTERPRIVASLAQARSALSKAQAKLGSVQNEEARRKAIYEQAKAVADEAHSNAHTIAENQRAIGLNGEAISRNGDVISAHGEVISADGDVRGVANEIRRIVGSLSRTDARIAELKRIIAADRIALSRRR